jgi:hypothetical protein
MERRRRRQQRYSGGPWSPCRAAGWGPPSAGRRRVRRRRVGGKWLVFGLVLWSRSGGVRFGPVRPFMGHSLFRSVANLKKATEAIKLSCLWPFSNIKKHTFKFKRHLSKRNLWQIPAQPVSYQFTAVPTYAPELASVFPCSSQISCTTWLLCDRHPTRLSADRWWVPFGLL